MKGMSRRCRAISVGAAIALLAGCGGNAGSEVTPAIAVAPATLPHQRTFTYTGKAQTFKVPAHVTEINVVARGAAGGGSYFGHGGRVYASIPVRSGETLYVFVGGAAHGVTGRTTSLGGFNGGGNGCAA